MRFYLCLMLAGALILTGLTAWNSSAAAQADNIRRISVADARAAFDKGKAVIIDVRGDAAFKQGHIKGAQSIPLKDLTARAGELPKDKTIILYCSCPAEQSSLAGARFLHDKGVDNTAALVGGYPAWKNAGYPVEENSSE